LELVADDQVISDTIYWLNKGLELGHIDLDVWLKVIAWHLSFPKLSGFLSFFFFFLSNSTPFPIFQFFFADDANVGKGAIQEACTRHEDCH
jgi:hypothetical protein